ncbi:MAG: DUF3224 domain-containing protein [Candidatus Omnitrophica bacterium]|nr:DUF3224 domain-containing protein [Candidatus Omnitrophota bacterium]
MDRRLEQTAKATFQITKWEETPFSEVEYGPKLTRGKFVLAYQGDFQGEGILEELKVHFTSKRASIYGLQRMTGQLGDLSGSFVLKHEGRFTNGIVSVKQTVVPGSATGSLKGLRGEINLRSAAAKEFPITFHYHFA